MSSLLITTSREPSRRTRSFVNDLIKVIPNSIKLNRGKATYEDIAAIAKRYFSYGVLIVLEKKGNPSALAYLVPASTASLTRKYLVLISSLKLLREIRDHQIPYNMRKLVLNFNRVPQGFPQRVCEVLIEIFRPALVQESVEFPEIVELKVSGDENSVSVAFYCFSTGRACGPAFNVTKIYSYPS
ncbi:MAG: hypothetical protein QN229_05765 [Desulfurococcaceae archaeon TW002]